MSDYHDNWKPGDELESLSEALAASKEREAGLTAEVERFRQAIERHKERIPFKEPDYEDYQLWKALDWEE